ncbi:MAG: hypothetical protein H6723_07850 [Sandaracinus sp.]|nr:hypothetical protein [Sandaracinus sp.]
MLHRAVLGSVERFFGVLLEHVGGNFPAWLAPEQLAIVTVASDYDAYAHEAAAELRKKGFRVTVDDSNERLGSKIREARLRRVPYVGVVGAKEAEGRGLQVRSRDENKDIGFLSLEDFTARLAGEHRPRAFADRRYDVASERLRSNASTRPLAGRRVSPERERLSRRFSTRAMWRRATRRVGNVGAAC